MITCGGPDVCRKQSRGVKEVFIELVNCLDKLDLAGRQPPPRSKVKSTVSPFLVQSVTPISWA